MWAYFAKIILRNRLAIILFLGLSTAFMVYKATFVQMHYKLAELLPANDKTKLDYLKFKKIFGEDGNVVVLGIKDDSLFQLEKFNAWYDLGNQIKEIEGVEEVISVAALFNLTKNEKDKLFDFKPLLQRKPQSQEELDSIKQVINSLPFYKDLIYHKANHASLMAITMNRTIINSKSRVKLIDDIKIAGNSFSNKQGIEIHYSGLPYIRTITSTMVEKELKMFVGFAALITSIILFFFFKSFRVVLFSMLIVAIGVIWSFATMSLLGFKITMLGALIPPPNHCHRNNQLYLSS